MQILYKSGSLCAALPSTQSAYQKGRSTIEQIQSIQQVIEYNKECFICFIDYTKAFDSIKQEKLWTALMLYTDLDKAYIKLLIRIYEHSKARIKTDVGLSALIDLLKGTKQGDILSAILFVWLLPRYS